MNDSADVIEELNFRALQATQADPIGQITAVEPHSAAYHLGVQAGDGLLAVNRMPCQDVIDVQFYSAEHWLELKILRGDQILTLAGRREEGQPLGLSFAHPTFDIDIRRCNNLCPFCFVLQMGPRFRRTLYIKDDDYRYSFLFGHYVTLTNLSAHDWQRILVQRLSPLYVSVHATELEKRRECLRNPTAPDIMAQLRELAKHRFEVHTQVVVTPNLNDGEHLQKTIFDLAELHPSVASVSVVPVGLTKFHRYGYAPATVQQAREVLENVEKWQTEFLDRFGVRFVYCTDEYYLVTGRELPPLEAYDGLALHENGLGMVRAFLDEWEAVKAEELPNLETAVRHITLVTATLAAPILQRAAQELEAATGVKTDVIAVTNRKLGETITVAGLLMGEDVMAALQTQTLGEMVVLPRIMFDHPDGVSLDDVSPAAIAQAIGKPIVLADWMGDVVDALLGQNKLLFSPDAACTDVIMQAGGWAVEKYL